jgi:hypothetical protein
MIAISAAIENSHHLTAGVGGVCCADIPVIDAALE